MSDNEQQMIVIATHPQSTDILRIGMDQETARRFKMSAGAPYVWWDKDERSWLITKPGIDNAIQHARRLGIVVLDKRDNDRRGPWCGQCDERTRHIPSISGVIVRCPRCHPDAGQPTHLLPDDETPGQEIYREGVRKVREQLARLRAGRSEPNDDDEGMPF